MTRAGRSSWSWITAALASAALALAASAAAEPSAGELARDILRELVEIRTAHPDGDNAAAARAMARRLVEAGFDAADVQVIEPAPLKGNLVARLRGTGEARPLLLLAHIDVVDAGAGDWSGGLDPWKLTERDGWLYGRGALDDKAAAAAYVATLIRLKRDGWRGRRDIIVALTADEEGGTHNGVDWLLENRRALIDAELAINEGGYAVVRDGRPAFLGVQVGEKVYLSFELQAANPGGHSALPRADNAIYDLAAALDRLSRLELPVRLGPVARSLGAREALGKTGAMAEAMRAIADGTPTPEQLRLVAADPSHNAQLRTTCVATRIEGGHADNALPMRAKATVNCRLLPQEDPAFVRAEIEKAVGTRIKVSPTNEPRASRGTDPESRAMAIIVRTARSAWPGVHVGPVMSAGASDSARLRGAGIPVYGVLPIFMEASDWARMHGRDERIPAEAFGRAVDYFGRLIRALAESPEPLG